MPEQQEDVLRLDPFRGVRYDPDLDLASVTAPPYDVLDLEAVRELAAAEPHNLVRLLLPQGSTVEERLTTARATLDRWLADGTLRVDPQPALYVYEAARGGQALLRGLVGALQLPPPGASAVLPHEDVMAPVVADRAALQAGLQAQVEPIWLVYEGGGPASDLVESTADEQPLEECVTPDGTRHRLWAVTDTARIAASRADLATRQAMIADGHHRFAAYQQVQAQGRETGARHGPWDSGLALLVDTTRHAPGLAAIHRVVRGLDRPLLLPGAAAVPVPDWRGALETLRPGSVLLVGPAGTAERVDLPTGSERHRMFEGTAAARRPAAWRDLDAALLHEVLLPALAVPEEAVSYHHAAADAVARATQDGGLAVLLAPVPLGTVLELAAAGVRMPRKSTSFGPKPRGGFVLRTFGA